MYDLEQGSGGDDARELHAADRAQAHTDQFLESFGARGWMKRKLRKSMRRLRDILEEDRGRGEEPSIAGGPRKPVTGRRFAGNG